MLSGLPSFFSLLRPPPSSTLFPYTTLFRSLLPTQRRTQEPHDGSHRPDGPRRPIGTIDRKSTRLNSSHITISYAVFCLKKKKQTPKALAPSDSPLHPAVSSPIEELRASTGD